LVDGNELVLSWVIPIVATSIPDAAALRAVFEAPAVCTVGLEEEVMLLDPEGLGLLPRAAEVVAAAASDLVQPEMPASHLELVVGPTCTVGELITRLAAARELAARAAAGIGKLAAVGAHPFAAPVGVLTDSPRYAPVVAEYGSIARRQLVCALQVHVAVRPAARAVAVYNSLRCYLPELAAMAANAPFHAGADTGLASIRPKISESLPRQGIPPVFHDVDELAEALAWSSRAGALKSCRQWWWELRLHPFYGTIEVRVPDSQSSLREVGRVAAVVQSLCCCLGDRFEAGESLPTAETWRIEQNRWSACRYGLDGTLANLVTGRAVPTRDRLRTVFEEISTAAQQLGCAPELADAVRALDLPSAPQSHRDVAQEQGLHGLVRWLCDRFIDPDTSSIRADPPGPGCVPDQVPRGGMFS
jgi:carboxylate-amine ligase